MSQLVNRLNHQSEGQFGKIKLEFESSFIPKVILEDFYKKLESEIPSPHVVAYTFNYLENHFLKFFRQFNPDPNVWYHKYIDQWAAGHSDISVTNEYLEDTREMDDDIFQP